MEGFIMKKFTIGILVGVTSTVLASASALAHFHHKVIKPIKDEEKKFEEADVRKARKSSFAHSSKY